MNAPTAKPMAELAQEALSALVGLPLSDMWRYAGCQKFEFGEQKKHANRYGEQVTWADWGLVVSCRWRLEGPNGFVLSSEHFGSKSERYDDHADEFYQELDANPPLVESVEVLDNGALHFRLSHGYKLALDPSGQNEEWRFMPDDDPRGHLVLESGIVHWTGGP